MAVETVFRVVQLLIFITFIGHRAYYNRKFPPAAGTTIESRQLGKVAQAAQLLAIPGLLALVIYAAYPRWMAWASLPLPIWLRWIGVGLALGGFGLLQWSHAALGKNWSDMPRITAEQGIVTHGPYRWIRHPIYASFLLILGSPLLIAANWFIGGVWLATTAIDVAGRIRFEEEKLSARFGDAYRAHEARTGRLLPRL